jgi:hypothetical protein
MAKEKDFQINQTVRKLQILNEDIKNELLMNPCIVDQEAFVDDLHNNFRKFINKNYRD